MEPIIIQKLGGKLLHLFRQDPVCTVTKAEQTRKLLGEDVVSLTVVSAQPLPFVIGDSLRWLGEEYVLNQMPTADKKGGQFVYELQLEGVQYSLLHALYFNTDVTGFFTGGEFSLTGDISLFASVLLNNLNRVYPGQWSLGRVVTNPVVKTLTFSSENCLSVLQKLCQEFGTEFRIYQPGDGSKVLYLEAIGQVLSHRFAYGQGRGLYSVKRQSVSDKEFVTRLYAFGGTKNLKSDYRGYSARLRMNTEGSYLEKASARQAFGLIEGSRVWDDIYPRRTGIVSTVGTEAAGLPFTFVDTTMDFDLMAESGPALVSNGKEVRQYSYLLGGVTPKVSVKTGRLAGYEFEISAYDHASKTFTLIPFKDERGQPFPAPGVFDLQVGDTYVLLDIVMPASYIESAEAELQATAQAWLDGNAAPRVQYSLTLDRAYLQTQAGPGGGIVNYFELGDYIQIVDADLNIDGASRVIGYTRSLFDPYDYQLTIADHYEGTLIERILAMESAVNTIVRINDLADANRARQGWRTTQELLSMIFDQDDYFKDGKIRPESIETQMLSVGSKSQQFTLNVVIEPNFGGQANVVQVNAGILTHYAIEDDIRTWQIAAAKTTIPDDRARYIYARCHRTDYARASLVFSREKIKPTEEVGWYHFIVGVLHVRESATNVRWISLTYGATAINGRFITTGRIKSADNRTYFDLDSGEIGGKITFVAADGSKKEVATLELSARAFVDSLAGSLTNQTDGKVESWFSPSAPNTWPSSDRLRHHGDTWLNTGNSQLFRYVSTTNSWLPNLNKEAIAAQLLALKTDNLYTRVRTTFTDEPVAPFVVGDYWINGQGLYRCVEAKVAGEAFDPLDWVQVAYYDDTVTTINGGVVTSGRIQLAGSNAAVKAGITGEGDTDSSVRFWAGAAYENRSLAPFRVLQSGEVFARKRIELMNASNEGEAGISGSNNKADGDVRFWAGSDYEGRETAPFQVLKDGSVIATKGLIGRWVISGDGIVNNDGSAYIITRTSTTINRTEARIGANVFPATFGGKGAGMFVATEADMATVNYGAVFEASGGRENYAIYADKGSSLIGSGLINGRRYLGMNVKDVTVLVDPSQYDMITFYCTGASAGIKWKANPLQFPIRNGKEMTILNLNDSFNTLYLVGIVRGTASYRMTGGTVLTLVYDNGFWYVKSAFDNTYGTTASPFTGINVNNLGSGREPAPVVNSAPELVTGYPDQIINSNGTKTYTVPLGTFSDPGDTLVWSARLSSGSALPGNITFDATTRTYTIVITDAVTNGTTYSLLTTVTDTANQTATDTFVITVDRNATGGSSTSGGTVAASGTGTYNGSTVSYIITNS